MAKKFKKHKSPGTPLPARLKKARLEGRTQQALELVKELYKSDPSEANKSLVREVYLERGQQLHQQGLWKEALQVFENAIPLGGPPEFLASLAEKLAGVGALNKALAIVDPGSSQRGKILAQAVDFALRKGAAGKSLVPVDLQAGFDLILQAFTLTEAGQDEAARTALQAIGLQSPYLEWKVFLRGLLAYYALDDVRALENWQRLDFNRLPAHLAAPLRFAIDPPFRQAQAPARQEALKAVHGRLQSSTLVSGLRGLQMEMVKGRSLAPAFRKVESLLPRLKAEAPQLIPRLANCFRSEIIQLGHPEDMDRYHRAFGDPPDDPHLYRLQAVCLEKRDSYREAVEAWKAYEEVVAKHPEIWPPGQATQVRAMIWSHMGLLTKEPLEDLAKGFGAVFPVPLRHPRLSSEWPPEKCFARSLELLPDRLATHHELFQYHLHRKETAQTIEAGRQLLERFPNHVPALEALGEIALEEPNYAQAVEYFQRALKTNPLEKELRNQLSRAHTCLARDLANGKKFDEARAQAQSALTFNDLPQRFPLYCLQAALELKAKNDPRAQVLIQQAQGESDHPVAVAYALVCESIRLGLIPAQKKLFKQQFDDALKQDLTPQAGWFLLEQMIRQQGAGLRYHGQLTHEKNILAALKKSNLHLSATEEDFEKICLSLRGLEVEYFSHWEHFVLLGLKRFPENPQLQLHKIEVDLKHSKGLPSFWTVQALQQLRKTIDALPRGIRQQHLLDSWLVLDKQSRALSSLQNLFMEMDDDYEGYEDDCDDDLDDGDGFF